MQGNPVISPPRSRRRATSGALPQQDLLLGPSSPPRRSSAAQARAFFSPRRGTGGDGVPPTFVGDRRGSVMSGVSAATSVKSSATATSRKTVQTMLEEVEEQTGWRAEDLSLSYSDFVKYRRVLPEDLGCSTWVDILSKDGKPLRRNVGLLRYLGGVSFADGMWVGIEVVGRPLKDNANDGMVFGVRYFECDVGKGLFVKHKWARRSFLQRPRGHYDTCITSAETVQDIGGCFNIEASPLHAAGILDVARAVPRVVACAAGGDGKKLSQEEEEDDDEDVVAAGRLDESSALDSRSRTTSIGSSMSSGSYRQRHQTHAAGGGGVHGLTHKDMEAWSRADGSTAAAAAAAAAKRSSAGSDQRFIERTYRRTREKAHQEVDLYYAVALRYLESINHHPPSSMVAGIKYLEKAGLLQGH